LAIRSVSALAVSGVAANANTKAAPAIGVSMRFNAIMVSSLMITGFQTGTL